MRNIIKNLSHIRRAIFAGALLSAAPGLASAQVVPSTSGIGGSIVTGICSLIGPFVGSNSQVLSIVFLVSLGVMVFLWFLNENKEGVMVWLLRTGVALAVLINIFTLPPLIGLPAVCGGVA